MIPKPSNAVPEGHEPGEPLHLPSPVRRIWVQRVWILDRSLPWDHLLNELLVIKVDFGINLGAARRDSAMHPVPRSPNKSHCSGGFPPRRDKQADLSCSRGFLLIEHRGLIGPRQSAR